MPSLDSAEKWGTMIEEEERSGGIIAGSLGDGSFDPSIAVAVAPLGVEALSHTACQNKINGDRFGKSSSDFASVELLARSKYSTENPSQLGCGEFA